MPSEYSLSDVLERLYGNQQALEAAIMEPPPICSRAGGDGRKRVGAFPDARRQD
jgi:hypothetical protein